MACSLPSITFGMPKPTFHVEVIVKKNTKINWIDGFTAPKIEPVSRLPGGVSVAYCDIQISFTLIIEKFHSNICLADLCENNPKFSDFAISIKSETQRPFRCSFDFLGLLRPSKPPTVGTVLPLWSPLGQTKSPTASEIHPLRSQVGCCHKPPRARVLRPFWSPTEPFMLHTVRPLWTALASHCPQRLFIMGPHWTAQAAHSPRRLSNSLMRLQWSSGNLCTASNELCNRALLWGRWGEACREPGSCAYPL